MTTALKSAVPASILTKADPNSPAFRVEGRRRIFLRAGTVVNFGAGGVENQTEHEIVIGSSDLVPGTDFAIVVNDDGEAIALPAGRTPEDGFVEIGGFHFAPGGNATARAGGDSEPAINPFSCWDLNFRPACTDPRGMALVDLPGGSKIWVDIYKLNVNHMAGTSRFGVTIADGVDLPLRIDGQGHYDALDYQTAVTILAHHGKQLLSYDEYRVAAFGVTEKTSAARDPKLTGLDAARTSQRGIMQASGNLWDWGHDGDPDIPRASLFGGSWIDGSKAGSRYARLVFWPEFSYDSISARGRSDHLQLA
ncbi:MAG: hypothetical protein EOS73_28650 [Mesorhizobium sp.]|uniref:phage major tropism determinant n=1 Tax=Mesorhizobium sp. M7A.F.Ca.ET.027.02.1.1 TaxID=2496655 RepID=UPI000FD3F47A|nr:hypothetical protein [Mesorhizobium sp. M7A.F.Ca.ET.027.02.1.1]RVD18434.1 hypothetical protein EN749_05090 [Mesorhizobium sp. M7A.F.Ca.ET.027.02.1.1]RWC99171.1 MAG: hypothetical protein EOS73_28650 [Mesorhizobium sp.]